MHTRVETVGWVVELVGEIQGGQNKETMNDLIRKLVDRDVVFPSDIKRKLLSIRLKHELDTVKADCTNDGVARLLSSMSPFAPGHIGDPGMDDVDTSGDSRSRADRGEKKLPAPTFDPLRPTMAGLDGDIDTKATMATTVFVSDLLVYCVQMGEDAVSTLKLLLQKLVDQYEQFVEAMASPPDAMGDMLDIARAMLTLLDPSSLEVDMKLVMDVINAGVKDQATPLAQVSLAMSGSPFYQALCTEFQQKAATASMHLPELAKHMQAILDLQYRTEADIDAASKVLDALPALREALRKGATYPVECKVQSFLEGAGDRLKAAATQKTLEATAVAAFADCVSRALKQWPNAEPFVGLHAWALRQSAEQALQVRAATFWRAVQACDGEAGIVFGAFSDVDNAWQGCEDMEWDPKDLGNIVGFVQRAAARVTDSFPENIACIDTLAALLSAAGKDQAPEAAWAALDLLHAASRLEAAMEVFAVEGVEFEALVALDADLNKAKRLIRGRMDLDEKFATDDVEFDADNMPPKLRDLLASAVDLEKRVRDAAIKKHVDDIYKRLEVTKGFAGGGNDGGSWRDGLDDEATLEQVQEMAIASSLRRTPSVYQDGAEQLAAHLEQYNACCSVFDCEPDAGFITAVQTEISKLFVTWAEGMLCHLFSTVADEKQLKIKVHGVEPFFTQPFCRQRLICFLPIACWRVRFG